MKREDSLAQRIERFFIANPEEILTLPDLCLKFEATKKSVKAAVLYIERRGGALKRINGEVWGLQA